MAKFLPAEGSTFGDEAGTIVTLTDRPRFVDVDAPYYSAFAEYANGLECEVQWHCLPDWLANLEYGSHLRWGWRKSCGLVIPDPKGVTRASRIAKQAA